MWGRMKRHAYINQVFIRSSFHALFITTMGDSRKLIEEIVYLSIFFYLIYLEDGMFGSFERTINIVEILT